jgi:hypothetical protein
MDEEKERCREALDLMVEGMVAFKEAIEILLPYDVQRANMLVMLANGMNAELSKVWVTGVYQEVVSSRGIDLLRGLLVQYRQIAIENLEMARRVANVPVA